ncbi:MAG: glycosyltransferase family 2 protein [bacterium]
MPHTNIPVSFVIPNYNGRDFINVCLNSIAKQTYKSFEVIVVDDASTDNSCDFIRSNYPWVRIIQLEHNAGFCHAVNTGIRASKGNYIALINNDVELDKDWLIHMVQTMQAYPDAFGISSKVLNYYDRKIIDDAGDIYTREGLAFKRWNNLPDEKFNHQTEEIFSPSGAASLFSVSALDKVGLWDEHFIAYLDDVDIGFRARLLGYKNYYEPKAIAYHMVSRSYSRNKVAMGALVLRNNTAVIIKDMPLPLIISFFPWLVIGHLKIVKFILSIGGLKALIKGYIMLIKMIPYLLQSRSVIKGKTVITVKALKKAILKGYNHRTGTYVH